MAIAIRNNEEVRECKNLRWLLDRKHSVTKLTWFGLDSGLYDGILIAELPDNWVYITRFASRHVFDYKLANGTFKHLKVKYV